MKEERLKDFKYQCEESEIDKLLKEWKTRLDLSDWFIEVRDNCPICDFNLENCAGECEWDLVHKCAVIRLMQESEYGNRILPYDKEKTLVHELLHIKFALIDNSGNDIVDRYIHQLIEDLAKAFVKVKGRTINNVK